MSHNQQSFSSLACPLCLEAHSKIYFEDKHREYWQCQHCHLVFVPKQFWLSSSDEKALYDLHDNNPQDLGYRRFLSRLSTPMFDLLPETRRGLDFGCGPGPTLSVMFEEQGHTMDVYDLFYHQNRSVFERSYDFICTTEVVEHLQSPQKEIDRLFNLLRPTGLLGIMTKLVIDKSAFARWHYIQDLSHICFFSQDTFRFLATKYHAEVQFIGNDVIILRKN